MIKSQSTIGNHSRHTPLPLEAKIAKTHIRLGFKNKMEAD